MTTPIDLNGIMPMQWVYEIKPTVTTSQTLNVKYGQRSVDSANRVTVEPGVYMLSWDTNIPDGKWVSFYFRDPSSFERVFTNFGSLNPSGRRRVVIPKKTHLYCYAALEAQISTVEPVLGVTLVPVAPLANAFEA